MRINLQMTQQQFGEFLCMKESSAGRRIRAYENGEIKIKPTLALLLWYVKEYGANYDVAAALRKGI